MKKVIIILSFLIVTILSLTNPSEKEHKENVKAYLDLTLENKLGKELASSWTENVVNKIVDITFKRNNYLLFSTLENDRGVTFSYGILGKIYVRKHNI
jgi:hypothetical protein